MRHISSVFGFICLLAAVACEATLPTPSAEKSQAAIDAVSRKSVLDCGSDCNAIMRAAISWVSEKRSVPRARLLLDTVRTGRSGYLGASLVSRSAIDDLAQTSKIGGKSSEDAMGKCFGPFVGPITASCRPFEHKVMMTLYAPVMNTSNPSEASMLVMASWGVAPKPQGRGVWESAGYRLTLNRGASGWQVVSAKLVVQM